MSVDLKCDMCEKRATGVQEVELSAQSLGWYEPKPFLHFCSDKCLYGWAKYWTEGLSASELEAVAE